MHLLQPCCFLALRSGRSYVTATLSLTFLLCEMGIIKSGGNAPVVVGLGQAGALLLPTGWGGT